MRRVSWGIALRESSTTNTPEAAGVARRRSARCAARRLAGGPDATPSSVLVAAPSSFDALSPINPLSPPTFRITEPTAEISKARLVTSDGHAIDLVPNVNADADRSVVGFASPDVVLRYGEMHHIDSSGIVDLAGVHGAASDLTFETPAEPPLVAEDGFEGVTAAGVALVIKARRIGAGTARSARAWHVRRRHRQLSEEASHRARGARRSRGGKTRSVRLRANPP
jgi:hypothetical protein